LSCWDLKIDWQIWSGCQRISFQWVQVGHSEERPHKRSKQFLFTLLQISPTEICSFVYSDRWRAATSLSEPSVSLFLSRGSQQLPWPSLTGIGVRWLLWMTPVTPVESSYATAWVNLLRNLKKSDANTLNSCFIVTFYRIKWMSHFQQVSLTLSLDLIILF